jgi:hypothetical protein
MAVQPEVTQTAQHSGALLDHLARRMRVRSEAVLAPLGLRPRHLVALTVLRDGGGSTQQALAATLEMDGTNLVGLLNDLEAKNLIERRRSTEDRRRRHMVGASRMGVRRDKPSGETEPRGLRPPGRGPLPCARRRQGAGRSWSRLRAPSTARPDRRPGKNGRGDIP